MCDGTGIPRFRACDPPHMSAWSAHRRIRNGGHRTAICDWMNRPMEAVASSHHDGPPRYIHRVKGLQTPSVHLGEVDRTSMVHTRGSPGVALFGGPLSQSPQEVVFTAEAMVLLPRACAMEMARRPIYRLPRETRPPTRLQAPTRTDPNRSSLRARPHSRRGVLPDPAAHGLSLTELGGAVSAISLSQGHPGAPERSSLASSCCTPQGSACTSASGHRILSIPENGCTFDKTCEVFRSWRRPATWHDVGRSCISAGSWLRRHEHEWW